MGDLCKTLLLHKEEKVLSFVKLNTFACSFYPINPAMDFCYLNAVEVMHMKVTNSVLTVARWLAVVVSTKRP